MIVQPLPGLLTPTTDTGKVLAVARDVMIERLAHGLPVAWISSSIDTWRKTKSFQVDTKRLRPLILHGWVAARYHHAPGDEPMKDPNDPRGPWYIARIGAGLRSPRWSTEELSMLLTQVPALLDPEASPVTEELKISFAAWHEFAPSSLTMSDEQAFHELVTDIAAATGHEVLALASVPLAEEDQRA